MTNAPSDWVKTILLEASKLGARLFRRQVGLAWMGSQVIRNPNGSVTIMDPRPLKSGVVGQADTDGWVSVVVTPEMVGTRVAIFTAIEAKTGTGKLSPEQRQYLDVVKAAGGRAGMARDLSDVARILSGG